MSRRFHPCTIFLAMLMAACGGPKKVTQVVVPATFVEKPPAWVASRPVDPGFYIGIGLASKSRPDAMEAAKQSALNDLASEISVTVEGNSLLYTLEGKDQFNETFTGTIKTSSNESIDGFERVGTWENASEYWVYFRLSKAEHARLKAAKRADAVNIALDYRARSQQNLAAGALREAFDQSLRALLALKAYWGGNDLVEIEGQQVPIVNALYADLQKVTSGVRIQVLPERCSLSYANGFKRELLIGATYMTNSGAKALVQMPLFITYSGTGGKVTELKNTGMDGKTTTTIQRINITATPLEVVVKLHVDEMISRELDRSLVNALVSSLTIPETHVVIDLELPKLRLHATETNLSLPFSGAGIAQAVREELTTHGFRFVDRDADADLILDLQAASRKGSESNGFFTAYLDVSYRFLDRKTKEVVQEGGKQGVKGVQLTYEKAGIESFKKARPEIRSELVPGIMNAFH